MRRGDAKPRCAARLMTIANDEPLEREAQYLTPRAKAKLSPGYS
jgi:hypothetical protein